MSKLPALIPDDPLRATPPRPARAAPPATPVAIPDEPEPEPAPAPSRRRATRRAAQATQSVAPKTTRGGEWTGATDVTTFRLPVEVLHALHERSRQLDIAKGMTVAAALLELLDRGDDELVELVESIQQRYDTARRRSRRAA